MRLIIEDIMLVEDGTPRGGVAFAGETLADFLNDTACLTLDGINRDLESCGLEPITLEQIRIVGVEEESMNKPVLITYHYDGDDKEWWGRVSYVFIYDHNSKLGKDIEQASSEGWWKSEAGQRAGAEFYDKWGIKDEDIVFYLRYEDAPTEEKMIEELKANDIIVEKI